MLRLPECYLSLDIVQNDILMQKKEITKTKNAIVMACDASYAPYAFALTKQIIECHPARDFDICIYSALPLFLPKELEKLGIIFELVPLQNPFEGGPNISRHGSETYLRLLIPGLVVGRYDRVLYLDSDIWHQGGGIEHLLNVDLKGTVLGAIRDNLQWRTPTRHNPEFKALSRPVTPYFNAGVLLIDVNLFVEKDLLGQCKKIWKESPSVLTRHDQSLLNLVLNGNWTELSPVWNWQYTWASRFFTDLVEPRFTHFIGSRKPWKDQKAQLPPKYRRSYFEFVTTYFPDMKEITTISPDDPAWPARPKRTFLKHIASTNAMQRYLEHFPNIFTTRLASNPRLSQG